MNCFTSNVSFVSYRNFSSFYKQILPFLAYYSEAAQASWEASPSKVSARETYISIFFLFAKSSFLRLRNYIFGTVSKNSRVHTPLTFLIFFLVFVQNSKKRHIF